MKKIFLIALLLLSFGASAAVSHDYETYMVMEDEEFFTSMDMHGYMEEEDDNDFMWMDMHLHSEYPDGIVWMDMHYSDFDDEETWMHEEHHSSTVPLSSAVWLFASGLIGMVSVGRHRTNAKN